MNKKSLYKSIIENLDLESIINKSINESFKSKIINSLSLKQNDIPDLSNCSIFNKDNNSLKFSEINDNDIIGVVKINDSKHQFIDLFVKSMKLWGEWMGTIKNDDFKNNVLYNLSKVYQYYKQNINNNGMWNPMVSVNLDINDNIIKGIVQRFSTQCLELPILIIHNKCIIFLKPSILNQISNNNVNNKIKEINNPRTELKQKKISGYTEVLKLVNDYINKKYNINNFIKNYNTLCDLLNKLNIHDDNSYYNWLLEFSEMKNNIIIKYIPNKEKLDKVDEQIKNCCKTLYKQYQSLYKKDKIMIDKYKNTIIPAMNEIKKIN